MFDRAAILERAGAIARCAMKHRGPAIRIDMSSETAAGQAQAHKLLGISGRGPSGSELCGVRVGLDESLGLGVLKFIDADASSRVVQS